MKLIQFLETSYNTEQYSKDNNHIMYNMEYGTNPAPGVLSSELEQQY